METNQVYVQSNPVNPIPASLQTILADLDFLSQIQRNMKPCYNKRVLVNAESWLGALYRRFITGDDRLAGITKIQDIVNTAIEAIENKNYQEHLSLTVNELYKASHGLINLRHTYDKDPDIKSKLNVQLKNVNIQLERYRHLIRGYTPPSHHQHKVDDETQNISTTQPNTTLNIVQPSIGGVPNIVQPVQPTNTSNQNNQSPNQPDTEEKLDLIETPDSEKKKGRKFRVRKGDGFAQEKVE